MSEYNTNQDGQWKTSDQWRAEEANDHSNPKKNKNGGRMPSGNALTICAEPVRLNGFWREILKGALTISVIAG